ncbi:MAG: ECF transporter S component [Solobacterium sp.]|nr:ECF transporter S component [Solobacterium sp.]MCH4221768.1 ECF transporter S component [Solobacterium sp.]MCH4266235.1 ECF transporter S component [Solobacterium sp.]
MKHRTSIRHLTLAAMFLALALVLPFLTGQIPQIGSMLLPMHLPVLFCGLICGPFYGAVVGFIAPLLRSMIFGMPPMFPTATAMAFELCTYGLVSGLVYSHVKHQNIKIVYLSLLTAMVSGRIVWGIVEVILMNLQGSSFTFQAFLSAAILTAVPGIILQLVLIPVIMAALNKAGAVRYRSTD